MSGDTFIEAHGLSRHYTVTAGRVDGLCNVSLSIRRGEFVAVMGASGSGKSTLMNLIGLLDRPTAGRLCVAGADVGALSPDGASRLRNRHIGFVFQSYHLLARRTALANVGLPLAYRGMPRKARRTRAATALARVGLKGREDAFPHELSGGQQQRVAIARALVTDPDLLLADEPTGALDAVSAAGVLDLLQSLRDEGRIVIVVTHDQAVAARAARLIVLRAGGIAHDGPTRGLAAA